MSRSERDLVSALRAELAAIDPSRPCDRRAEAAGLGTSAPNREGPVARLVIRLSRGPGRGRAPGRITAGRPSADGSDDPVVEFDWPSAAEHCRMAYLRGLFLARGSLSLANGRTHLEFVVEPDEAPALAERLGEVELPASWRVRRGRGVVTWKSSDTVGLFLRRIGAGGALLELEARQVVARAAGRPEPRPQRGVGEPPALRRCGRPADRRDRRTGRRRPSRRSAVRRPPRRRCSERDPGSDARRAGRAARSPPLRRPARARTH